MDRIVFIIYAPFFYSVQVLVGNRITWCGNKTIRQTIFGITHQIGTHCQQDIDRAVFPSSNLKKQLHWLIIIHNISYLIQDQLKAFVELLFIYGS
jgi:hypothetical protein